MRPFVLRFNLIKTSKEAISVMTMHTPRLLTLLIIAVFFTIGFPSTTAISGGLGGFNIPDESDLPDVEDIVEDLTDVDHILANLPGFGLSMDQDDPITTSLDDAVTDCPFLDTYPAAEILPGLNFLPMCELTMGSDNNYMLMPGRYEYQIESFCLHAGTHGPGEGDGYLWAPLKGPWSDILYNILTRSEEHQEFSQQEIQYFIWAVLARTPVTDMNSDMQRIAATLLTDEEFLTVNGGAFGIIQGNLIGDVFQQLDLPPEAETVMRSQADIRWLATQGLGSYDEMESVAVLAGNPPADQQERVIGQERWSYHPDGYFVRYDPSGYSSNHLEIVVPDSCTFDFDDDGSVLSIEDAHGNRIELDGSTLFFTCPNYASAGSTLEAEWTGFSVDNLVPSSWTEQHRSEVERLCGEAMGVDSIVEIGRFAHAVELVVQSGRDNSGLGPQAQDLAKIGWMDAVVRVSMSSAENRIASSKDLPEFDWRDRWRPHDPSDGSANPGNRGRQRLGGRDPRPSEDPDWGEGGWLPEFKPDKPQANKAMDGVEKFSDVTDKLSWIENGPGNVVNSWGFAIPNKIFNDGLKWVVGLWETCTSQISQDPPRFDYDEIYQPRTFTYYFLQSPQDGPPEMVNAQNDLLISFLDVGVFLQAALVSMERYSGAIIDGEDNWAWEQSKAFVFYEHRSGEAMLVAADNIDDYLALLRSQGVTDIFVTPEDFAAGQQELIENGPSPESIELARTLGLSDEVIQAFIARDISKDPNEASGSVMEAAEELADALREFGQYLMSLPAPGEGENLVEGGWLTVGISP